MPFSPAAQNPWFLIKKIMILLPAAGKRIPLRLCLSCCDSLGQTFNCADSSQIIPFDFLFCSPAVIRITLHLQLPHSLFFCFWPKRAPLWQTDLRKKCFLSPKNTTFFNFRRTDFPKAPLCGFKSTPFTRLSAFFAPWASARQLSRMRRLGKIVLLSFPIPSLAFGF